MTLENFPFLARRGRVSLAAIILALLVAAVWAVAYFLQTAPPRHIVLASGLEDGLLHQHAKRYIEILARSGVTVEERITNGPGDNLRLLQDPRSGVDIGFTQGGIAKFPEADNVIMIASLYYVPMWIFHRSTDVLNHVNELRNHRVAVGVSGSGARSLGEHVFALNGLTSNNMAMLPLSNDAALLALQSGEVDAAIFVDGAENHAVWTALHDPNLKLLSYSKADAYHRRLSFITKLTLPPGVIDLANDIPEREVELIGTKEMLAARSGLHPALIHLLVDAAAKFTANRDFSSRQASFRERPKSISASRLMPINTSVSDGASSINICPSGSRHWPSEPSSYCSLWLQFCFRSSITFPSCAVGAFGHGSIDGMASWLCSSEMSQPARGHCRRRNGWLT